MFMTSVSEQLELLPYLNVIPQSFWIVVSMHLLMTKYLQATQCATAPNPSNQDEPQEDYEFKATLYYIVSLWAPWVIQLDSVPKKLTATEIR